MPWISTSEITPQSSWTPGHTLQIYNGLDVCVTLEVWEELTRLHPAVSSSPIYSFERALQGPYLEIMQRGFLVNEIGRHEAAQVLRARLAGLDAKLQILSNAVWDRGLNPRSPKQLIDFFYSRMKLPEIWLNQKGERKLSTNREALEKLESYMHARPFISLILSSRDIGKQLDVLESAIDADGRFRAGYNIAGTETGRPSSSTNAYGTAGNAQNIAPGLRHIFVADPGMKMCVIDLEQVEARDVGFFCGCLFDDWTYLDACESGDLHTNNAKKVWPELNWTWEAKKDRAVADRLFYREFSYRDMAKRGSHLSNYSGTAWTASRSLKVPLEVMEEFQARYCRGRYGHKHLPDIDPAFPCIPKWWAWTAEQLQLNGWLETPFGRKRHFFGRPGDDTTIREAIAFMPQSTTADRMNLGLWRVWYKMPQVQLLAQTYDSITFQGPDDAKFDLLVQEALERIRIELVAPNGRKYAVPGEAKVGWNWGAANAKNPEGLAKWSLQGDRRQRLVGLKRIMN